MSIGVIGQGFVGGSLTTVLSERGEKVYAFDKAGKTAPGGISTFSGEKRPNSVSQFVSMCEQTDRFSGVFFVCVPTPMYEDGSADISIVDEILQQIHEAPVSTHVSRIAVIKSTVPPGSTANWNKKYSERGLTTVFNPEFLTEANALNDMREQNRIILGGPRPQINRVKQIFQKSFPKIPIIKTGSTTAEMVKYLTNCYLAVKVSFANEVSQICEKLDENGYNIDYDKVVEYAKFDKRLGDTHWAVPGPVPTHDGRYVRGFGGHCIIRDTQVHTPGGNTVIQNIEPGQHVISTNHLIDSINEKLVNEIHARLYSGEVYTFAVDFEGEVRKITCTPCHLLPVKRNGNILLLQAKDIVDSDELFIS